jgi:hypothetical protein
MADLGQSSTRPGRLTVRQCQILSSLARGPLTSRELADVLGMRSTSSLATPLKPLVHNGHLTAEQVEAGYYGERRCELTDGAAGYRRRH